MPTNSAFFHLLSLYETDFWSAPSMPPRLILLLTCLADCLYILHCIYTRLRGFAIIIIIIIFCRPTLQLFYNFLLLLFEIRSSNEFWNINTRMMGLSPTILSNILKARLVLKHRQVRFKIKLSVNRSIRTR